MTSDLKLPALPLGQNCFNAIRKAGMVYVDKTDLIFDLAGYPVFYLLTRPHGFGKSLMISTLEELFAHGSGAFRDLKFARKGSWPERTYPVISLNFAALTEAGRASGADLDSVLCSVLKEKFRRAGLQVDEALWRRTNWYIGMYASLSALEDGSLVVLVDDFDAPLACAAHLDANFKEKQKFLNSFMALLKCCAHKLWFVLITGTCRFADLLLSPAFGILQDISFNGDFAALTGFTVKELEQYFAAQLEHAAAVFNERLQTKIWDKASMLEALAEQYGGYSFSDGSEQYKVCDPFSVLCFLANPAAGFISYRNRGAAAAAAAAADLALTEPDFAFSVPRSRLLSGRFFADLAGRVGIEAVQLFEQGFLTIKENKGELYRLGIPNCAIRRAFMQGT